MCDCYYKLQKTVVRQCNATFLANINKTSNYLVLSLNVACLTQQWQRGLPKNISQYLLDKRALCTHHLHQEVRYLHSII